MESFFSVCQELDFTRYLTGDGQKYRLKIPAEISLDRTSLKGLFPLQESILSKEEGNEDDDGEE